MHECAECLSACTCLYLPSRKGCHLPRPVEPGLAARPSACRLKNGEIPSQKV